MTGLDPIGRKDIRELILALRDEGKTVFYSTHILPDVEMTCDRVSIIHKGETKRTGKLADILTSTTRGVSVAFTSVPEARVASICAEHPQAKLQDGALLVEFEDLERARAFADGLAGTGARLARFEPHRDDLESIFVRSLGEAYVEESA